MVEPMEGLEEVGVWEARWKRGRESRQLQPATKEEAIKWALAQTASHYEIMSETGWVTLTPDGKEEEVTP